MIFLAFYLENWFLSARNIKNGFKMGSWHFLNRVLGLVTLRRSFCKRVQVLGMFRDAISRLTDLFCLYEDNGMNPLISVM